MNLLARLKAAARVVWRGTVSEATEEEIFGTPVPWSEFFTANGRPLSPVARVYGPDTQPEKNATLRTLQDHDLARNRSRVLAETNPNAIGLLQRVIAYVVGRGSSTEVQSAVEGQDPPKRLSKRVTDFVATFKRTNQWLAREKEIQWRLHVDGEFFLRFFPHPDGTTRVRFVEAANVRPPAGEDAEGPWSFGVYTPDGDAEEPTHYCVHNFQTNEDEIVEAHFIIHGKINCLSNQKRGVPSLYACDGDLTGAAKLRHATREGEKNRASINYFRRHKAASEGTMRAFRESQARAVGLLADPSAPDNASQVYVEIIQPGSTIDIPEGLDPLPPPGSPNVQGSATSVEQAMEAVAARFGVPVWVVSGKTDQGNFAQSLVVESPFTVTVEDAQGALAEWSDLAQTKAIEIAVEQGLLPEDVLDVIDLAVSFPSPVSRNQMEQTQRCKILRDNNIISEREWTVEEGYDPEKQRQQIIEERKDPIGYIPSTIREVIRPGVTQAGTPVAGTPQGDAQAKAAGNGAAPSSTPAARYAQMAGRLREQADEMLRLAEAEWDESQHPRGQPENAGEFGPGGGGNASKGGTAKQAGGAAKAPTPATKRGLLGRLFGALGMLKEPSPPSPDWSAVKDSTPAQRLEGSPARKDFGAKLDASQSRHWDAVARAEGTDAAGAQKAAAEKAQKLVNTLAVHSRVRNEKTLNLILDGGFKNQFQTGTSTALYDPKGRAAAEHKSMGVPLDTPADQRPMYGYLAPAGSHPDKQASKNYGDVVVKMRDGVKSRATVTMGDSLRGATNGEFAASPYSAVSHQSINPGDLSAVGSKSLDDFESFDKAHQTYVEAHVHGGVAPFDIEHVQFRDPPSAETQSKLKSLGISWSQYQ